MSRPSSPKTMCTSTELCRCHEQVRHIRSPNWSWPQRIASSAVIASRSGSWSAGAVAKQHLLQRVAAEPEPQRLERDDLLGRDVAEVDVRTEVPDEPRLRRLRRRLEDQVADGDLVHDLVDEAGAHLARRPVDPCGAALAALCDHLPGASVELFLDPLDPEVGRVVDVGVLRTDLGQDDEVTRELVDQLELPLARDFERPVRNLDVGEAEVVQPLLELVQATARVDDLEERPAADDRRLERAVERDLLLEVVRDVRRAPAELDDVDEGARGVEEALDVAQVH